jgi:hypothetical protein
MTFASVFLSSTPALILTLLSRKWPHLHLPLFYLSKPPNGVAQRQGGAGERLRLLSRHFWKRAASPQGEALSAGAVVRPLESIQRPLEFHPKSYRTKLLENKPLL